MFKTTIISICGAILTIMSLTGCASKINPQVNPNPKYFMTVTGHIDPAFRQGLKVTWTAEYDSNNTQCDYIEHWAAGKTYRLKNKNYPVIPNKNGNYQITIPINYYLPGYCKWEISEIYYRYRYKTMSMPLTSTTGLGIAKDGKKSLLPMKQTWICNKSQCQLTNNSTDGVPYNLSNKFSSKVIVNFKYQDREK